MENERNKMNECYKCTNKRNVPGDCHIKCVEPDANMTGDKHGIRSGWFMYPFLFDPVWKTKLCDNFNSNESNKDAISDAVSGVVSESKAH